MYWHKDNKANFTHSRRIPKRIYLSTVPEDRLTTALDHTISNLDVTEDNDASTVVNDTMHILRRDEHVATARVTEIARYKFYTLLRSRYMSGNVAPNVQETTKIEVLKELHQYAFTNLSGRTLILN